MSDFQDSTHFSGRSHMPTHMIRQPDTVYPHSDYRPGHGSHEDVCWQPGPEAKHPHPGVDVAAPSNEPKAAVE